MPLTTKPCVRYSHADVARSVDVCTAVLMTSRCRWSSSDRAQSFDRSKGSTGELKKNSPTLFIDFDSVYETRQPSPASR